jgi:hypothetical protein
MARAPHDAGHGDRLVVHHPEHVPAVAGRPHDLLAVRLGARGRAAWLRGQTRSTSRQTAMRRSCRPCTPCPSAPGYTGLHAARGFAAGSARLLTAALLSWPPSSSARSVKNCAVRSGPTTPAYFQRLTRARKSVKAAAGGFWKNADGRHRWRPSGQTWAKTQDHVEGKTVLGRPGSDLLFQALRLSTIGAGEFNGRVRDGIGF